VLFNESAKVNAHATAKARRVKKLLSRRRNQTLVTEFGAWTLLPPAIAIIFAMLTRKVYQALLFGIMVAGFMVAGGESFANQPWYSAIPAAIGGGFMQMVEWIVAGIADQYHAAVIAFTLFLGGLVALMQRAGGVQGFGNAALKVANTRRKGQFATAGIGSLFLAIDDYFHVVAAGTIFRPLTDKLKISREKLAYIIDSTAAPMVILIPISTWAGYIIGEIRKVGIEGVSPFGTFIEGIGFNFYAILTVLFVFAVSITRMEFGPMKKAEQRAVQEGKPFADGAKPLVSKELTEMQVTPGVVPRAINLALPVLFLLVTAVLMLYATGHTAGAGFKDSIYNSQAELSLAIATFLTLLFTMVLYSFQKIMKQEEFVDTTIDGFKAMMPALAILALAWGIGNAAGGVGLGEYLAGEVGTNLDAAVVPLIAFIASGIIAFATGTSFGTFAIMIPISLSIIAGSPDSSEWLGAALAATIGGAVFGDHCSPISDTTVMSSMAAQCDHIDHVKTQLPYALVVAGISTAGYAMLALSGLQWVAWATNIFLFTAVVSLGILFGKPAAWTGGQTVKAK
jgi:tetracycline resistance efflux pump